MNRTFVVLAIAIGFVILALGGGAIVSKNMNRGADQHSMSAGREGDARPNGLQEFQMDKAARGQSTKGSKTEGSGPTASR